MNFELYNITHFSPANKLTQRKRRRRRPGQLPLKKDTLTDESLYSSRSSPNSSSISIRSPSPTMPPAQELLMSQNGLPSKDSSLNSNSGPPIKPPKSPGKVRVGALSHFPDSKKVQLRNISSRSNRNVSPSPSYCSSVNSIYTPSSQSPISNRKNPNHHSLRFKSSESPPSPSSPELDFCSPHSRRSPRKGSHSPHSPRSPQKVSHSPRSPVSKQNSSRSARSPRSSSPHPLRNIRLSSQPVDMTQANIALLASWRKTSLAEPLIDPPKSPGALTVGSLFPLSDSKTGKLQDNSSCSNRNVSPTSLFYSSAHSLYTPFSQSPISHGHSPPSPRSQELGSGHTSRSFKKGCYSPRSPRSIQKGSSSPLSPRSPQMGSGSPRSPRSPSPNPLRNIRFSSQPVHMTHSNLALLAGRRKMSLGQNLKKTTKKGGRRTSNFLELPGVFRLPYTFFDSF